MSDTCGSGGVPRRTLLRMADGVDQALGQALDVRAADVLDDVERRMALLKARD